MSFPCILVLIFGCVAIAVAVVREKPVGSQFFWMVCLWLTELAYLGAFQWIR